MDNSKLDPILRKESILKTANALDLQQNPQEVLQRYSDYALTHVPLGETSRQLANLQRVIVQNKKCAVGTIVGPYGYGKTSTAVHLWHELRAQRILAVPPFLWKNLQELMDAVYHWIHFEFSLGPKAFINDLEKVYQNHRQGSIDEYTAEVDANVVQNWIEKGRLILEIRPEDAVGFFVHAGEICDQAGYLGMAIFTDELQATVAAYRTRDQFFADLFQIIKDILGLAGHWAFIISMDDETEGYIFRERSDLLQRLQASSLYFRVKDVYSRREYPSELWAAYEKRFSFDGSEIILGDTLEAIGQVAARNDLGAGPRMVTSALSLAVQYYVRTSKAYAPIQFVDDFLAGQMRFVQRGKFISAVKKALDNPSVASSQTYQQVVKLLAAYPMGCSEKVFDQFNLLAGFQSFPPLARAELIAQMSSGYILRYLAEEELEPEQIEQRLTKEFANRFAPSKAYAQRAAEGFLQQILLDPTFSDWKKELQRPVELGGVQYQAYVCQGTFDGHFPDRMVAVLTTAVPQSSAPLWKKGIPDVDIELRFELNYEIGPNEPSRVIVASETPNIVVFQLNVVAFSQLEADKILPSFLVAYYPHDRLTPLLTLALIEHLNRNKGESPDDRNRVSAIISPLRQYALQVLLNDKLETTPPTFASAMVGQERIKDLFRQQCRLLYPNYQTMMTSTKWVQNLQQYRYALQAVISEDGISIARGRRSWKASKESVADAFKIPARRLTSLEALLDTLDDLIDKEEFTGRHASSEVTLRFKLHPLEQEWLAKLDATSERVRLGDIEVPCLPATQLIRQSHARGYTLAEAGEILRLLQSRKYIDFDQDKDLLVRTVDALDDLRDAVQEQLNQLDKQVQELAIALPDFEKGAYPLAKLRTELAAAKERDQIETIKYEAREHTSKLNAFAASRHAHSRMKLKEEQDNLHEMVKQGIPSWLDKEYVGSPLRDTLEKQRKDLAAAYQTALEDIRHLRDDSIKDSQGIGGSNVGSVVRTYNLLQNLTRQSRTLKTRIQSYDDRRDDLEAWHQVSNMAVELGRKAQNAEQVYGNTMFKAEIEQLWASLQAQFDSEPLTILGKHELARQRIESRRKTVEEWLDGRREEFELLCQRYQKALALAAIIVELRVPFDQEQPSQSQTALIDNVSDHARRQFKLLSEKLYRAYQVIRYGIKVQRLPLADAEARAQRTLKQLPILEGQLTSEIIGDPDTFEKIVLVQLLSLAEAEKELGQQVLQIVLQRPAEGTETRLMSLLRSNASEHEIDLRGLIIRLLDQGEENVDLDALMKDLKSLFQKNQIAIHINLLRGENY